MRALLVIVAVLLVCPTGTAAEPEPLTVVVDADTANEIDDLYAITRAMLEPRFKVVGLSSAQWSNRVSGPDTVLRSQTMNETLVRLLGRTDVPTPLGSEMIFGKPWGGADPADSPAAQFVVRAARAMPAGRKLVVVSIGATTNLASALALAPDIVPKVSCYVLAAKYYADRKVWDKDEFNVRNDLNSANYLFNLEGLELHVMPVNVLYDFTFDQKETVDALAGKGALWDYLANRWLSVAAGDRKRIMWDLALVTALARPELATEAEVMPPPENARRRIFAYTKVDLDRMRADWWATARTAQAAGK